MTFIDTGPAPKWSRQSTSNGLPDPVERFRNQLRTLLSHRLKRGETIDSTEARTILAAASQALNEGTWR